MGGQGHVMTMTRVHTHKIKVADRNWPDLNTGTFRFTLNLFILTGVEVWFRQHTWLQLQSSTEGMSSLLLPT